MIRHAVADDRVAGLVIGRVELFLVAHDHRAALGAHHDFVFRFLEFLHAHDALVRACGKQRRLVDEVREVGAGESGRAARDDGRLDVVVERHLAHVYLEDQLAAANVGQRHDDLAVEAAGPQQRRIQHVGPVGRRDDDDAFVAFEAVHLDQHLVQGLLALVVTAAESRTAVPTDGVELVDEDDAGRLLLRLLEHVAHARGADADEHLHEVGTGNGEERNLGFAGDRLGEQRLTGSRRAHHEHALGDLAAEALEFARVLEELDDFGDFFLRLVNAGHVGERHTDLVLAEQARLALAERHGATAATAALHLAHEINPYADQQQYREGTDQELANQALRFRFLRREMNAVVFENADQRVVVRFRADRVVLQRLAIAVIDAFAVELDPLYLTGSNLQQEFRIVSSLGRLAADTTEPLHDRQEDHDDDDKNKNIFC